MNHSSFSVNSQIKIYHSDFAWEEARHTQGPGLGEAGDEPLTAGYIQKAGDTNLE